MRWPAYFIFAYLMLGLQVGVSHYIALWGAAPNLGLIAVIFIALNARRESALLGCFFIGLLQDLLTEQQPGLYALSYGLAALLATAIAQRDTRAHPLVHAALALAGSLITAIILLLHSRLHPAAPALTDLKISAARISPRLEAVRALYTVIVAPVVLFGMNALREVFDFKPARRKMYRKSR